MTTATQTIPAGYKQTEIGMIPEDWEVKNFREISTVNQGLQIPIEKRLKRPVKNSKIYITLQYLANHKEVEYILDYQQSVCCKKEDVLMTRTGNTGMVVSNVEGVFHNNFFKINFNRQIIDKDYLVYYLNDKKTQKNILIKAGTSTIPDLNHGDFYTLYLPLPNKPEQTAITTVLSDTDALIENLEKLIAKKIAIKQGAMQQLLTGKKRLPGFHGEWEVKQLSKISWFQEGPGVRTSQFTQSGIKLLNGTNIYKGKIDLTTTDRYISEKEAYGPYSHFMADEEDIVIASSGITIDKFEEKIAFVKKRNLPFCMNTSTIRFKVDKNLLVDRFLYYFLMTTKFKKQIGAQATGSAQLNFGPSHLDKVIIDVPPTKEEQTAIATVLSDMDAELEKLENKLSKYRQIKTGMMQQLLTGKIRLIHHS